MATMTRPDRRRPEPLWHQVEQSIRAAIDSGTWKSGARIPGEDQLTDLLGVSRITVRHALANLEAAGILRREHGRGTFVRSARLVAGTRALTSFSEEMAVLGLDVATRLLDVRRIRRQRTASPRRWRSTRATRSCGCERLRFGGGQPIGVQTAHLRGDRVDGLTAADLGDGSLYSLLRERYGIHPALAEEVYRVAGAGRRDAELLGIAPRRRRVRRRADHQRRARPVRVHAVDDARRPLRDPLVAARHLITNPPNSNQGATAMADHYLHRLVELIERAGTHERRRPRRRRRALRRHARRRRPRPPLRLRALGAAVPGGVPPLRQLRRVQPADRPADDVAQRARRRRGARAAVARAHRGLRRQVPRPPAAQRGRLPRRLQPLRAQRRRHRRRPLRQAARAVRRRRVVGGEPRPSRRRTRRASASPTSPTC